MDVNKAKHLAVCSSLPLPLFPSPHLTSSDLLFSFSSPLTDARNASRRHNAGRPSETIHRTRESEGGEREVARTSTGIKSRQCFYERHPSHLLSSHSSLYPIRFPLHPSPSLSLFFLMQRRCAWKEDDVFKG